MSAPPGLSPADAPSEEHGVSLLRPPAEAAALRRRRERPVEIGRYLLLLLGAICGGAGGALWITTGTVLVAGALVGFGLVLVALGATVHLVLLRERARHPELAHAWDEGIELLLHDGELKAASWTDPRLALDVFVTPRRGSTDDDRLLVWRMDAGVPPCDLSEVGFQQLMQVVTTHDLRLAEYRSGRRVREARAYEVRGRPGGPPAELPARSTEPSKTFP
jgi:hypothetical protein